VSNDIFSRNFLAFLTCTIIFYNKQPPINRRNNDSTTREIRISTPRSQKLSSIAIRRHIKKSHFCHLTLAQRLGSIQNPQTAAIIRLKRSVPDRILIMVDHLLARIKRVNLCGGRKRGNVPDHGARVVFAVVELIEFVVEEEVGLVGVKPALVSVLVSGVTLACDHSGGGFVADVDNGEGVFVVAEADFVSYEGGVRAVIDDALRVVDVTVVGEATGESGVDGVADVNHVETCTARLTSDAVRETGLFVNGDVVAISELIVMCGLLELDNSRGREIAAEKRDAFGGAELFEVKNLHAVSTCLADNESVVLVHFNISPIAVDSVRREESQN